MNVIDDEIRVLLAERLPRWEFGYLKSILQRDKKMQMDSILFNPDHAYRNRTRKVEEESLPESLEEWCRYRVALLGDLTENELTPAHQELLRRWVIEAGGNLIVIVGESMPGDFFKTPLAELFPVRNQRATAAKSGYELTVTAEGANAPPVLVAGDEITSLSVWEK
ncbi:MAG: hypothetical protein GWQ08_14440 [Verrucomicrobiaceae bacterium]|nr:hypothetical protein [Verrucomicrobiaceae bacterium]